MSLRVIGFTQSHAKELGQANIRVSAILPGIVEGPGMTRVIDARARHVRVSYAEMAKTHLERVSLRRMVKVDDVAGAVALLVSAAGRKRRGALTRGRISLLEISREQNRHRRLGFHRARLGYHLREGRP